MQFTSPAVPGFWTWISNAVDEVPVSSSSETQLFEMFSIGVTALGVDGGTRTARDVWRDPLDRHLRTDREAAEFLSTLDVIVDEGCLAERMLTRVGRNPAREALKELYSEIADSLRGGVLFRGRS